MSLTFTIPFVGTPAFYTGTSSSSLVPDVFPVAINGRPYMVDMKSGQLARGFEQRVRDSVDQSTAPGEAAINPGGLWRRGEVSWHYGAGQKYADTAESQDYRFYKSKGVNVWTKGQLTLLNTTKLSYGSASTTSHMVVQDGRVYVSLNGDVRYSTDPYTSISATVTNVSASAGTITYTTSAAHGFTAGQVVDITGIVPTAYNLTGATLATASGTSFTITNGATGTFVSGGSAVQRPFWTAVVDEAGGTAAPTGSVQAMATDGNDVYLAFPSDGVRKVDTSVDPAIISNTRFNTGAGSASHDYYMLGFAKGYMFGAHDQNLRQISGAGATTDRITIDDTTFRWVGVATGQNAVYAAGYVGKKSLIYKITIKADGTLDSGVVALELPTGEVVTAISGSLGFILIGTNKGVRFCSTDSNSNLVAGQIIPTSGPVKKFTSTDRFVWFTWSNYDGVSTGLGRLDLSTFTSANTPAFATDLMYTSTADVLNLITFDDKHCFVVSGIGVIAEDTANLVASGSIETGHYRWGIPDRKFVAKVDTRSLPLTGTIESYMALDGGNYALLGTWEGSGDTENSFSGSDDHTIEAQFKFVLNRQSALVGPTLTRWAARAYAAPFRSQFFRVPVLIHDRINVHGKDYYFDVNEELGELRQLIVLPRIVTLQINYETISVIVEDIEWVPVDSAERDWIWQGTATVTMRSVEE